MSVLLLFFLKCVSKQQPADVLLKLGTSNQQLESPTAEVAPTNARLSPEI